REQARIELEADLAAQRSRLQETVEALGEVRARLVELETETRRIQLQGINDSLQKIAALEQDRIKAAMRTRWMTLTAPVDGTVQQLAVHTVGGVVTPAQALMLIVPQQDALEVEAFVDNKDAGFVHAGQPAEVKVEAFPFTRYGTVPATVMSVSRDAISDERRGLVYAARIRLQRTTIRVDGREIGLAPGMAVSVGIKTGKRRVIDFFLSPLQQYRDESLRER
ncbi:MAG: HlyD family type I secretion periplasmic adaptor subunit, partial [Microvirgula sp.]